MTKAKREKAGWNTLGTRRYQRYADERSTTLTKPSSAQSLSPGESTKDWQSVLIAVQRAHQVEEEALKRILELDRSRLTVTQLLGVISSVALAIPLIAGLGLGLFEGTSKGLEIASSLLVFLIGTVAGWLSARTRDKMRSRDEELHRLRVLRAELNAALRDVEVSEKAREAAND